MTTNTPTEATITKTETPVTSDTAAQISAVMQDIKSTEATIIAKCEELRKLKAKLYPLGLKGNKALANEERAQRLKTRYATHNGLTIEKLRKAGLKVSVSHIRYTQQDGVKPLIPVPSYLRKVAEFTPFGGATHICIVLPTSDSVPICVSSVCHIDDCFDYKMGVKIALDQFTQEEADLLLSGSTLVEQAQTVTI